MRKKVLDHYVTQRRSKEVFLAEPIIPSQTLLKIHILNKFYLLLLANYVLSLLSELFIVIVKGQLISKGLPKNERKQVDMRYHSTVG